MWYGCDGTLAENSKLLPEVFVAVAESYLGIPLKTSEIKLLGTAGNAGLIASLARTIATRPAYITSPSICRSAAERSSPLMVMARLWQPAACGGFQGHEHRLDGWDHNVYGFIDAYTQKRGPDTVRALLRHHPAWPVLSWLPTLGGEAAADLLVKIVDPRWFLHPNRPNRLSKLMSWFYVSPEHISGLMDRRFASARLSSLLGCWYQSQASKAKIDYEMPGNFLWRIVRAGRDLSHGINSACRALLRLLTAVWLDKVRGANKAWEFDPDRFFSTPGESRSYTWHASRLEKS